jgi:hypothetical protein
LSFYASTFVPKLTTLVTERPPPAFASFCFIGEPGSDDFSLLMDIARACILYTGFVICFPVVWGWFIEATFR